MLAAIGVASIEDLFADIPAGVRLDRPLELPDGKPEAEVYETLAALAARNVSAEDEISFLGAGMYDHYVPGDRRLDHAALGVPDSVHALPARDLPGRAAGDVRVPDGDLGAHRAARSNASLYEGPSVGSRRRLPRQGRHRALAAGRLAWRSPAHAARRSRPTPPATAPRWSRSRSPAASPTPPRSSRRSTTTPPRCSSSTPTSSARSRTSRRWRRSRSGPVRSLVVPVDALTLGILRPPGELGADIAVGEGQPLGNRLDFGGPSFGFFAATEEHIRRMPGRIAGETPRRRRPARIRAHAADARAAHPPREGDLEHLHEPGAERARRRDPPELARQARSSSSSAS